MDGEDCRVLLRLAADGVFLGENPPEVRDNGENRPDSFLCVAQESMRPRDSSKDVHAATQLFLAARTGDRRRRGLKRLCGQAGCRHSSFGRNKAKKRRSFVKFDALCSVLYAAFGFGYSIIYKSILHII